MYETFDLFPGAKLRCVWDRRFKQSCLSIQFLRPMCRQEAAMNALIPAVLLRGSQQHPDLKCITERLDELYGASIGTLVRRIGDYQTTGFYCNFIEDRFALESDRLLEETIAFAGELLLQPLPAEEGFCPEFVESEKRNLIATIESEKADKRAYAAGQLLKIMGKEDSFGIPRLGDVEDVAAITPESAYRHYKRILEESPMEFFYVGSAPGQQVADLLNQVFGSLVRNCVSLPPQSAFHAAQKQDIVETMEVTQGKLCMGFLSPITNRSSQFAAMQVLCAVFGSGQTSKLFMQIREQQSLCYDISAAYYGSKGILTVFAGIDFDKETAVRQGILQQLQACQEGSITPAELNAAKQMLLSGLRTVTDAPGSIEGFTSTSIISGLDRTLDRYAAEIRAVTAGDVAQAAQSLALHSTFFLKGGAQ